MRARYLGLTLLIIIAGMGITSAHKGTLRDVERFLRRCGGDSWEQVAAAWGPIRLGGDRDWREYASSERSYAAVGLRQVAVENLNGAVTVVGNSLRDEIEVEVTEYRTPEGLKLNVPSPELTASRAGDTLVLRVRMVPAWLLCTRYHLHLVVPSRLEMAVTTVSGNVLVQEMAAPVQVKTASGEVRVQGGTKLEVTAASGDVVVNEVRGPVTIATASGDVRCAELHAACSLTSASGDLAASGLSGPLQARAVSGDLVITGYHGPHARLRSTSGDISVFSPAAAPRLTVNTVSGEVGIYLRHDSDYAFQVSTVSGDIAGSFESPRDLPLTWEERGHHRWRGRVGQGKGKIEVHTVSGSITLGREATRPGVGAAPLPPVRSSRRLLSDHADDGSPDSPAMKAVPGTAGTVKKERGREVYYDEDDYQTVR